jgi:hypothetical protein
LVDEAQNLPLESIEELRMLSNFQINGSPLLQSFLLGQNELNAIIQAPNMEQFRQRIIASSNLTPLHEEETREYVEFRFRAAGINKPLLSPDSYPLIHRFSRGIPRKINLLMDRVLLLGFLEQLSFLSAEHVQKVVDEINGEIAHQVPAPSLNSTATPSATSAEHTQASSGIEQDKPMQQLLNDSLELKIRMLKELDELILKRQRDQGLG